MIKYVTGNILESDAECLINTVNCEGYMGKGIAYQFKLKFPNNNKDYVKACKNGALMIGKIHHYVEDGKVIINFPTKIEWRKKSEIEYIEKGLVELVKLLPKLNVSSVAIPPLGCGNGGLRWDEVKTLIIKILGDLSDKYEFIIYEPSKNYIAKAKEAPELNVSALVLMEIKLGLNKFNTLRLQKTAYFLNIFLKEKYFKFQKHKYGPYDNSIAIISRNIKEFQNYYNTKDTNEAHKIAYNIIISNRSITKLRVIDPALKKSIDYVNKISSDNFLECVATITYLIEMNNFFNEKEIVNAFKAWSDDKAKRFSEDDILKGIDYLISTNIINKTFVGYEIR